VQHHDDADHAHPARSSHASAEIAGTANQTKPARQRFWRWARASAKPCFFAPSLEVLQRLLERHPRPKQQVLCWLIIFRLHHFGRRPINLGTARCGFSVRRNRASSAQALPVLGNPAIDSMPGCVKAGQGQHEAQRPQPPHAAQQRAPALTPPNFRHRRGAATSPLAIARPRPATAR